MTVKDFRDVLVAAAGKGRVHHYEAHKPDGDFVVWTEIDADPQIADDRHVTRVQRVQVDVYSGDEYCELPDTLAAVFEAEGIGYSEPYVSFEEDTGLSRWRFDTYFVRGREAAHG